MFCSTKICPSTAGHCVAGGCTAPASSVSRTSLDGANRCSGVRNNGHTARQNVSLSRPPGRVGSASTRMQRGWPTSFSPTRVPSARCSSHLRTSCVRAGLRNWPASVSCRGCQEAARAPPCVPRRRATPPCRKALSTHQGARGPCGNAAHNPPHDQRYTSVSRAPSAPVHSKCCSLGLTRVVVGQRPKKTPIRHRLTMVGGHQGQSGKRSHNSSSTAMIQIGPAFSQPRTYP